MTESIIFLERASILIEKCPNDEKKPKDSSLAVHQAKVLGKKNLYMEQKDLPRMGKLISINEEVAKGHHSILLKEKAREERDPKEKAEIKCRMKKLIKNL